MEIRAQVVVAVVSVRLIQRKCCAGYPGRFFCGAEAFVLSLSHSRSTPGVARESSSTDWVELSAIDTGNVMVSAAPGEGTIKNARQTARRVNF